MQMDRKLWEQLPVYRQLENEVKRYIAEHHLKRHDRLPPESQLAAEYGASIGTVRKALNNLVAENIIYRRRGQGTFVSPRSRKGRILVVPGHADIINNYYEDYAAFLFGALAEANSADLPCEPAIVDYDDFMRNIDDVKMIYPETAGVIFFRNHNNLLKTEKSLTRQGLPILFYGPNLYKENPEHYSAVYHNESIVATLLADFYAERGFRNVLILLGSHDIGSWRLRKLRDALAGKNIFCADETWENLKNDDRKFRSILSRFDVISCVQTETSIKVIQKIERELHLRVPDVIAVTGVDNLPAARSMKPSLTVVDLCNRENGQLCMRKFCQLIASGDRNFHINGKLELIRRESC